MIILVPIACLVIGWLLYPVLFPERPEAQPTDLERHQAQREAERQAAVAYWKGRGQVIKPLDRTRYSAWVDETKEMS